MKKLIPVLLFVIIPLFYSCVSRQQPDTEPTAVATITASNNGQSWSSVLTDTLKNDTMILHAKYKRDFLRIKFPVPGQTAYIPTKGDVEYITYAATGNQVTNTFKLDSTYQNMVSGLVLNTANPIHKYLSGQFNLRFVIDKTGINTDTTGVKPVTFTQGQFVAPYN